MGNLYNLNFLNPSWNLLLSKGKLRQSKTTCIKEIFSLKINIERIQSYFEDTIRRLVTEDHPGISGFGVLMHRGWMKPSDNTHPFSGWDCLWKKGGSRWMKKRKITLRKEDMSVCSLPRRGGEKGHLSRNFPVRLTSYSENKILGDKEGGGKEWEKRSQEEELNSWAGDSVTSETAPSCVQRSEKQLSLPNIPLRWLNTRNPLPKAEVELHFPLFSVLGLWPPVWWGGGFVQLSEPVTTHQ